MNPLFQPNLAQIFCICWDTPSGNTGFRQLPNVSSVLFPKNIVFAFIFGEAKQKNVEHQVGIQVFNNYQTHPVFCFRKISFCFHFWKGKAKNIKTPSRNTGFRQLPNVSSVLFQKMLSLLSFFWRSKALTLNSDPTPFVHESLLPAEYYWVWTVIAWCFQCCYS